MHNNVAIMIVPDKILYYDIPFQRYNEDIKWVVYIGLFCSEVFRVNWYRQDWSTVDRTTAAAGTHIQDMVSPVIT